MGKIPGGIVWDGARKMNRSRGATGKFNCDERSSPTTIYNLQFTIPLSARSSFPLARRQIFARGRFLTVLTLTMAVTRSVVLLKKKKKKEKETPAFQICLYKKKKREICGIM